MSVEVYIQFNSPGFRQILLSKGVKAEVDRIATQIQTEANANVTNSTGFSKAVMYGGYGGGRYVGYVQTTDRASVIAETERQVLTKAVHR